MNDSLPAISTIEEDALPVALVEAASGFMHEARAANTRAAYGTAWRLFRAWCAENGRTALPK